MWMPEFKVSFEQSVRLYESGRVVAIFRAFRVFRGQCLFG